MPGLFAERRELRMRAFSEALEKVKFPFESSVVFPEHFEPVRDGPNRVFRESFCVCLCDGA